MALIKVLHVGLDTHLGGIETYLLKISRNIDRSCFHFDFLAFDDEKPCFHDELSALGCGFRYITSRRRNWGRHIADFRNLLAEERYDIVHCHFNSLTDISYVNEALKAGIKVIVHSRNAGNAAGSSSRILGAINRRRLPADRITCAAVSDKAGEWMFGKGSDFIVLNNGLDTEQYRFSVERRRGVRSELKIDDTKEVIVNVGAFRPQKNHGFLVDVFDAYHKLHKDSVLLLVGEGELEPQIREKADSLGISDSVVFAGRREDIPAVLSAADKFLFPSLYEGFPNALIEAETSGLRCVAATSVTEQACLGNCARVDLDAPISEWVRALESEPPADRESCAEMVEKAGFGIRSEISRLEGLYRSLAGRCRVLELIGGSLTDGGAETLVKDYVLNIDKERFETAVFVDWIMPGTANTRILTESRQLLFSAYPRYSIFWRGMNKFFRSFFLSRAIERTLRKFNPDVIHVHLDALEYLPGNIRGRLLYTCHSTVDAMLVSTPKEDAAARRLSGEGILRFIALHKDMAQDLNDRYGTRDTVVVNNGIELDRFRHVSEPRESIRRSIGISENAFVVGNVARFVDFKNHPFTLEVFRRVKAMNADAHLLLVGDGEGLQDFIGKADAAGVLDSITILSNRTDIPRLLKAMDVFVLPSLYEGFPVSLVEAQASGLRCIVSDAINSATFLCDLVVPMSLEESPDRWRDAVLDQSRRGPFEDHLEDFDIKTVVKRLERIYLGEL